MAEPDLNRREEEFAAEGRSVLEFKQDRPRKIIPLTWTRSMRL